MSFNDIAMVYIKGKDYRIHFWYMSKEGAINIMKNSSLNEKTRSTTYHQRNKEVVLNGAIEYYKNNKEV